MIFNFLLFCVADRFPDLDDDPDSPASCGNNDQNMHILAAILNSIPKYINQTDFERLADLIPHREPVMLQRGQCKKLLW